MSISRGEAPRRGGEAKNRARSSEAAFTYLHILTYTYRHLHLLTYTYIHLHMFTNISHIYIIHISYTYTVYVYIMQIHICITALPVHCYDRFQKCHPHRGWEAHFRYFRSPFSTPQIPEVFPRENDRLRTPSGPLFNDFLLTFG